MSATGWRAALPTQAGTSAAPGKADRWLLWTALALSACGLLMVYSSSSALGLRSGNDLVYFQSQLQRWALGIGCLFLLAWFNPRQLAGRAGWAIWGALAILLALMLLPIGIAVKVRGASRWVPIGAGLIQPSEFARLAMLVCLASMLSRSRAALKTMRGVAAPAGVVLVTAGLIAAEPHMSLAILTAASGFLLIFLAGASIWRLGLIVLGCASGALLFARDYHWERLHSFFAGTSELGYQAYQSKLAVASGGLWGLGLGKGLQKYFFLPDPHTDFILSIVGEEAGLIGLFGLFALTSIVIARIFIIGRRSRGGFAELLAYGIGLQFMIAFLLHAAVCLVVAPTTGVPYPLVSFGGSALVANMMGIGLVLAVSRRPGTDNGIQMEESSRPWSWRGRIGR